MKQKVTNTDPVFGDTRLIAQQTSAAFTAIVLITSTHAAVTTTSLWTCNARHNYTSELHVCSFLPANIQLSGSACELFSSSSTATVSPWHIRKS